MAGLYFKETQKVNLGWKWIFFIALYILMFWALVDQLKPSKDMVGLASIFFSLLLIVFFNILIVLMKLKTEITELGISFQFKPFHRKPELFTWNEISDFYIRDYRAFREYGGHGLHRNPKRGRSLTVSGKTGLQLVLNNGYLVLIGTQKPKELTMVIDNFKSKKK